MLGGTNISVWIWVVLVVVVATGGYYFWTSEDAGEGVIRRRGVVTGIMYAEERSSAVVDSEIVYEGDTIHGVRVVKIHSDKVEFQRKNKRWSQGVQEKPNRAWP